MITYIKQLRKNILVKNFVSLGLVQAVNLFVPLIVTPYLIATIGLSNFGKVTFAFGIMAFFTVIVEYGFNLSATQKVSLNRASVENLQSIFSKTILAKLILLFMVFALLLCLFFFSKFSDDKVLFLTSFFIVIGQAFLPIWMFQGLENMRPLAVINISGRVIYMLLIFLFVRSPFQYILVNLFWGLNLLFSAVICIAYLNARYRLRLVFASINTLTESLKGSFYLFITNFSVNIYIYSNAIILGFFTDYKTVGLFGIAEKVLQLLRQILIIYSQVIYPSLCKKASEGIELYRKYLSKIYILFFTAFLILCFIFFLFSVEIAHYFQSTNNDTLVYIIKIFIASVVFTCLNIPATQTLLAFNFQRSCSIVWVLSCLISIFLNLFLTARFSIYGTAYTILFTEVLVMAGLHLTLLLYHRGYYFLKTKKIAG